MAGGLVGGRGAVVGVDREALPLAVARDRARDAGFGHVTFAHGEIAALPPGLGVFDAVVGRRVLMYQPDTVGAVRELARSLRPGGWIVLQEHDTTMVPACLAPMPLHRRAQDWIKRTIAAEGADIHMGFNLHGVLTRAGLAVEHVRAEAIVQTPGAPYAIGAIVRAILPRILRHGVATAEQVDIETLDRRLDEERERSDATFVGDMMFGAWARTPE